MNARTPYSARHALAKSRTRGRNRAGLTCGHALALEAGPTIDAVGAMRTVAVAKDAVASVTLSLALLFREISLGMCRVSDAFFSDERAFLITTATANPAPLSEQYLELLSDVLAGVDQVNLALGLGVAASTVASRSRHVFDTVGLSNARSARPHPLLMLAAVAFRTSDPELRGKLSFVGSTTAQRVISIARPESALADLVTTAELAIVRYLVEGEPHENIARSRGTSQRTVANQVSSIFKRVNVSGRNALLLHLFKRSRCSFLGDRQPDQPRAQTNGTTGRGGHVSLRRNPACTDMTQAPARTALEEHS